MIRVLGLVALVLGLVAMHALPMEPDDPAASNVAVAPGHSLMRMSGTARSAVVSASFHRSDTGMCGTAHSVECVPSPVRRAGPRVQPDTIESGAHDVVEAGAGEPVRFDAAGWAPVHPPPVMVLRR